MKTSLMPSPATRPLSLRLYRQISLIATPFVRILLKKRLARGKEDPIRLQERMGIASLPRPAGRLIWVHAASVGETMSILPLVERIIATGASVLLTTGTVTSAKLVETRLPKGALHHFVPVDVASAVERFLDHWRPDLTIFCESELWPNLMAETHRRGIPVGIVNGRMSARSYRGWQRAPNLARALLGPLAFCLGQTEADAAHFRGLGADAHSVGNLKYDGAALPVDGAAEAILRAEIAGRPVFLAASTHPGEDEIMLRVAQVLRKVCPDLLTILVPRHPERGHAIAQMARQAGETLAQRSAHEPITGQTQLYLADTLGELGLFYTLSDLALIGGSLMPVGGHNPIEAARCHAPILTGPHVHNFTEMFDGFLAAKAAILVQDEAALIIEAGRLLHDRTARNALRDAGAAFVASQEGALARSLSVIQPYLSRPVG